MPVRLITVYACIKVFGEALARYYLDRFGMSMICIRKVWFQPYDSELLRRYPTMLSMSCSPAQQLVGYEPQDRAADYFVGEGA